MSGFLKMEEEERPGLKLKQKSKKNLLANKSMTSIRSSIFASSLIGGGSNTELQFEEIPEKRKQSQSLAFRKKQIFLHLAFSFGLALFLIVLYDYIQLFIYEQSTVTQQWLTQLLLFHVVSCYINLLGFIYANESGDLRNVKLSGLFGILNLCGFILRVVYQIQYADFLPELFSSSS